MAAPTSIRISLRAATLAIALGTAVSLTAGVLAQSGSHRMVIAEDDGGPPQVMHFAMPDFFELRQPDFTKRDAPTFTEKLVLSDEQSAVVERLIAEYLEAFKKLAIEHLPKGPAGMRFNLGGEGEEGDGGALVMMVPGMALGGEANQGDGELPDLGELMEGNPDLEDIEGEFGGEMGGEMRIGVMVSAGGPAGSDGSGDDGADGGQDGAVVAGDSGVSIAIGGADGQELSPELRKKLEAAAEKMAKEMQARIEKQMAEGGGHEPGMLPLGEGMSIEEMQKRNEEMAAQAELFRKAKAGLRQTFVNNVHTNLAEPQMVRWPDLERTLLREKTLPKGRLSGERTDLVKVLKAIELAESERAGLTEPVMNYELALDNALKQRNEHLPEAESKLDKAMQEGEHDKALAIIDRATALRIAVRSVNEQFMDMIAAKLPAEKAAAFRERALKISYPAVYRTTSGQKLFMAANKIEGLDAKVAAGIKELEKAYAVELKDVNEQIRQAIWKNQPLESRQPIEHMKQVQSGAHPEALEFFPAGAGAQGPVRDAFAKRRDVDDRFGKLVRDMLTPEQVALLPKAQAKGKAAEPVIIRRTISGE